MTTERKPRPGDFSQVAKSVEDEATRDRERDREVDQRAETPRDPDRVDEPKKGAA